MSNWKVNLDEVSEEHQVWTWKDGSYERFRKRISAALGNSPETLHPFDVERVRVPPGARPCPVHRHSRQWELFIVVSGRGTVRRDGQTAEVGPGDCFIQPAGTAHRIANADESRDLVFYVIANEDASEQGERLEV